MGVRPIELPRGCPLLKRAAVGGAILRAPWACRLGIVSEGPTGCPCGVWRVAWPWGPGALGRWGQRSSTEDGIKASRLAQSPGVSADKENRTALPTPPETGPQLSFWVSARGVAENLITSCK